ncbi:MAG: uroporphyrinogen-III synthase [Ornithinimicrobium sp.]|uniref:uroporphyrinogen-III synthase n=1 Tax=Ornithinimicrobium sp. TaxID=1977084 RepID=UPI003D9B44F8
MSTQSAASTSSSTSAPSARVAFVGAGPGDPGLLTVRARDYLSAADVVVLDSLHRAEEVRRYTRTDAEILDGRQGESGKALTPASRASLVVRTARRFSDHGMLVVRLMDGDPSAFSGLTTEALACSKAGVPFEIVPGVSTAWSVPAYAGVPLTGRGVRELHMINAGDTKTDWSLSVADDITVVLLGAPGDLRKSLLGLRKAGRDVQTPVALTEHGTTVTQHTHVTCLDDAVEQLAGDELGEVSVAVVGEQVALRGELSWYESKPLFGWHILVPRTQDQAGPMRERIAAYGATAAVVPTISVEPPRTPQQMDKAIKGLVTGRYEWVGFTSVNAVRAIREKFTECGLDARAFAGLKIAAVGGVTAEALREWGLEPDLMPEQEQSARGLLEAWPPFDDVLDPINRVLLPRADIATDTLVAGLQQIGWHVDDVTAYRTVRATPPPAPVREAIKGGEFDAVCFTSSSTVRNLVGIAGKPHPCTVVACIGPATARTAEEHGLRVDVVAPEASSASLIDALAAHAGDVADATTQAGEEVLRPSQRRPAGRRAQPKARA